MSFASFCRLVFLVVLSLSVIVSTTALPLAHHRRSGDSAGLAAASEDGVDNTSRLDALTFSASREEYFPRRRDLSILQSKVTHMKRDFSSSEVEKRGQPEAQYLPGGTGTGGQYSKDQPYGR
ncbi:hypothetical protein EDD21DRAFT_378352 [Dissophora ornata]|nr:hypothetical protein EDD21DRAFT_378352 [Dissophora ornata]